MNYWDTIEDWRIGKWGMGATSCDQTPTPECGYLRKPVCGREMTQPESHWICAPSIDLGPWYLYIAAAIGIYYYIATRRAK